MNPQYLPPPGMEVPKFGGNQNFENISLTSSPTSNAGYHQNGHSLGPSVPGSVKTMGGSSAPPSHKMSSGHQSLGNPPLPEQKINSQIMPGEGPPSHLNNVYAATSLDNPERFSQTQTSSHGQEYIPSQNPPTHQPSLNGPPIQNNNFISPPLLPNSSINPGVQFAGPKSTPVLSNQFENSGPQKHQNPHISGPVPPLNAKQVPPIGHPNPLPGQINSFQGPPSQLPNRVPPMSPPQMQPLHALGPQKFTQHAGPIHPPGQLPPQPDLSNQMQGMNLNGPKPHPYMPQTINQPNYTNQGARNQSGYPPMPQQPGGYPPQPAGYPQQPGGYSQHPGGYPQQPAQQQKRLDPDQMPSPIQVTQDDQRTRSGPFITNQKGLVPPLVTTKFVVQDQGNSSPRFIRSTMYNVPITQDIMKQTGVPFSLVISPMARLEEGEYPPPIVNFGDVGPVRCIRCKAYMCPFMQFIDSGRRFQCLFCKATTDVPAEYFQHLDHTGNRMDKYERPELVLGTYEFVATKDYCRNNVLPQPPAIIFIIDVSYNNIKSGMVQLVCSQMKEIIKNLPVDQGQEKSNMRVGYITYNSSVHFYNIKGSLAAPQMMVVGDTQEMFMPLLDGFLSTVEESEAVIDALMEQIPVMFADTKETEIVLLPAILAGLEALKASNCVGKLMVFHSTLPTAEAPGKLRNRDDRKLLGTDKERTVLNPQTQAYNQLGQDCVAAGCSVDLFIFNNSYIDISTISQVSRLTGGEIFKYTYFQADVDGERLVKDIIMDISRPIAFDGVMRVRTSTGVRPTDFYGYFYMSNTRDMEIAAIDCDKGVAIEIKHDDKLSEEEGVYIQTALLYTSCSGQRRLRILNLSLKACSQMADLYRSCDLDTVINYIAKQSTYKLLDNNPKVVKDTIVNRAAQILATYRKNCATPSSAGQLILPECMKLLPLYVNCLLKSDALSGGSDMSIDDRAFAMQYVLMMNVSTSVNYFYPRLIPIHDIDASKEKVEIPASVRCTIEKINDQGVYILENGLYMFLWVGLGASPEFVQNVFGCPSAIQIDIEQPFLPELNTPLSIAVRNIIEEIRIQRHRCLRLTIVRQKEKLEHVFKHFLVEDRGNDGSASYVDFLCHMHKEIRSLLS